MTTQTTGCKAAVACACCALLLRMFSSHQVKSEMRVTGASGARHLGGSHRLLLVGGQAAEERCAGRGEGLTRALRGRGKISARQLVVVQVRV